MITTAIKTTLIKEDDNIYEIIRKSIKKIKENSVLVVTSKIVSFCQGRIIKKSPQEKLEKQNIIKEEADLYLDPHLSQYNITLTIKNSTLAVNAGIDESNADGGYVLWPKNLQETTNNIWKFVRKHYQVKHVGVIISDSKTIPLRWGVVGTAISYCGFKPLYDYRGKKDLFGREIKMSQINLPEAIAVAAVLEMGEVAERTPLCIVENIKKIEFLNNIPSKKELKSQIIAPVDDVYAPLLTSVKWLKKD